MICRRRTWCLSPFQTGTATSWLQEDVAVRCYQHQGDTYKKAKSLLFNCAGRAVCVAEGDSRSHTGCVLLRLPDITDSRRIDGWAAWSQMGSVRLSQSLHSGHYADSCFRKTRIPSAHFCSNSSRHWLREFIHKIYCCSELCFSMSVCLSVYRMWFASTTIEFSW